MKQINDGNSSTSNCVCVFDNEHDFLLWKLILSYRYVVLKSHDEVNKNISSEKISIKKLRNLYLKINPKVANFP